MPKCLRKRCSTPQKQPAANVAVCVISDMFRAVDSEVKDRKVEIVENARKYRENKVDLIADGAKAINQMEYVLR